MVTRNMLEKITKNTKIAYSIEEMAAQTSLSKAFIRLEIKRGKLRATKFGRRVLIRYEDMSEYISNGSDGGGQMELEQ